MSTNESTTKPPPNEEDRRHRRSQRSRAHVVSLGRCPKCGATLPASLVSSGFCPEWRFR